MTRYLLPTPALPFTVPVGEWWVGYDPKRRRITHKPTLVFPDEIHPRGWRRLECFGGEHGEGKRFDTQAKAKAWVQQQRARWRAEREAERSQGESAGG